MLVDAASLTKIAKTNKMVVDITKANTWNYSPQCYLMMHAAHNATMQVKKRRFDTRHVQIKYFEATWPGAFVAHRIQPLHGSMHTYTKKKHRSHDEVQQQVQGPWL